MAFNDYIIIQIDTDCAEHKNYGVSLTVNGADKADDILIGEVVDLILSKIGEIPDEFRDRIIFAVGVHCVECWLLPLWVTGKGANKTKNCEGHLSRALNRADKDSSKEYRNYLELSKSFRKMRKITEACRTNRSLEVFVQSLP